MSPVLFSILLVLQLAVQGCVVFSNITPAASSMAGLVALLLALIQTVVVGILMLVPYSLPENPLGAAIAMFIHSGWLGLLVSAALLYTVSFIPGALVTASVWTLVWKSTALGCVLNALYAPILERNR